MTAKRKPLAGEAHKWEFKARFRRHAFGWKSQPAITRVKQAVAEIKKIAKKDPMLAAEGAITFLERVSPALEHVDSSSGSIGAAVNNAIAELVPLVASAPADAATREAWLERLFDAYQDDGIPYIEWLDPQDRVLPDDACPTCGTMMKETRGTLHTPVNGEDVAVAVANVPHFKCSKCREQVLTYTQARRFEEDAIGLYRKEVRTPLGRRDPRHPRASQRDAGRARSASAPGAEHDLSMGVGAQCLDRSARRAATPHP